MVRFGSGLVVGAALVAACLGQSASAQGFPSRPIRIVVPFAAGGDLDTLARSLGARMAEGFGQPVLVDNRVGAGGNIGADAVAKSAPDGYTILLSTPGLAIGPALYRKLPFDPVRDLAPVSQVISTTVVMVASQKLPASSVRELVALAKARPGGLNYGSSGIGSVLHLTMDMFKSTAGIDMVHVPYKGDAPVFAALLGGELELAMAPLSTTLPQLKGGKVKAIAVTSPRRSALLPDVPTVSESGYEGFESTSWQGLFAPARTPREAVDAIQKELVRVLRIPEVRERLQASAQEPVGSTPDEFEARFRADVARFARIIREARIPQQE